MSNWIIEAIGWSSTVAFLISIVMSKRLHLHQLGVFTAITTGIYAYAHGATAIWVKWAIAFFFHAYMVRKQSSINKTGPNRDQSGLVTQEAAFSLANKL